MASNKKITELTELTEIDLSDDDVLPIVDVSAGTTNKVRKSTLASALAGVASMSATSPVSVNQATGAVTVSLDTVPITSGGTGAVTADDARNNLGAALDPTDTRGDLITRGITTLDKLAIGSNNYVLKSNGTDPVWGQVDGGEVTGTVAVVNGGTGSTTSSGALTNLGAAASGANTDITSLGGLTTDIAVVDGGTGASTASAARTNLGAAASGANTDITSLAADIVISGSTSGDALRITQTGAGNALKVEDSTNPDSTPFVVTGAGNVGIGQSSATRKLEINAGAVGDIATFTDGVATNFTFKTDGSSVGTFGTEAGGTSFALMVAGTEKLRLENDGGVKVINAAYNPITTDNDLSFDQSASNNFKCTPSGTGTLTFTNHTDGQSGNILLINSGGHAISLAATTKGDANLATTISAAGTYWLSYYDDGTNAYVVTSAVFA